MSEYDGRHSHEADLVGIVDYEKTRSTWPGFPRSSYFAARFSGFLNVATAGAYQFWLGSDDGSMLYLGDTLVINNDGFHSERWKDGVRNLTQGEHPIVVEFFENSGDAFLRLEWSGPDTNNTRQPVNESVLSRDPSSTNACAFTCGSPGEVENDPTLGHFMPGYLDPSDTGLNDDHYDLRRTDRFYSSLGKSTVWTMQVLDAQDQLRQRMAWALSQIFVASAESNLWLTEKWLNYYDIFVRGAFGSYLQLMREVTYSPVMGEWLTHVRSSSYESDKTEPNENFARELMQLFTIGLIKMNPDGSSQRVDGEEVNTYSTRNILSFARVFTGFRL